MRWMNSTGIRTRELRLPSG